jgi:hypothetical protein
MWLWKDAHVAGSWDHIRDHGTSRRAHNSKDDAEVRDQQSNHRGQEKEDCCNAVPQPDLVGLTL